MADIRINQLPAGGGPVATDVVPIDSSAAGTTRKVQIQDLVVVGRPTASQAEAEAATDPLKVMTPLTTGQAVSFYGLTKAGNLSGLANPATARTNLGVPAEVAKQVIEFDPRMSQFAGGAPMNGVDDDQPAIQAAIDYLKTLGGLYTGGYGRLRIPRGTVRIESKINITGAHGVMLAGEGDANTTFKGTGNFPIFEGTDTTANPLIRLQMRDFTIEGPGYTNALADGISLGANNNCLFKDVRIWACRTAFGHKNSFHTELINMRMNGLGGLANYNGIYSYDGNPAVQENAIGVYGGRIQGCKNVGWRGESVTGSSVFGLEVLGCEVGGVWFGQSPTGKDLKWFTWVGGLIDTCPFLLRVIKGTSAMGNNMHWSGMWLGYANAPDNNAIGIDFRGLTDCSVSADMIVNVLFAANIQDCDRIGFRAASIDAYDRLNTGSVAIICNGTNHSRFDIGSTHKASGSSSTVAFVEQGDANHNLITGVFDGAVTTIGAQSNKVNTIIY